MLNSAGYLTALPLRIILKHKQFKQKTTMKKILIFASAMVFVLGTSLMATAQNATTKTPPQKAAKSMEHQKTAAKTEAATTTKEVKATANSTTDHAKMNVATTSKEVKATANTATETAHVKTAKHSKSAKTVKPVEQKK